MDIELAPKLQKKNPVSKSKTTKKGNQTKK